jgi:ATP-dependent DNA helicase RecQ
MRRALASLAEAGVISYQPARRTRGLQMLDEYPVKQLRIRPNDLARRAALEQRKLREMISFCYVETCYRAFILDYFGDRSHAANCGMCGNCLADSKETTRAKTVADESGIATAVAGSMSIPLDPPTRLDRFRMEHTPTGLDLEDELRAQTELRRMREEAERSDAAAPQSVSINEARALTDTESLRVRKILACAARMQGRFGKGLLASTLRGSRARNVTQAGLERLSTYGILSDMTQDELLLYIDALVSAGCLTVSTGTYPTVSLTPFGSQIMREQNSVRLALPVEAVNQPRAASPANAHLSGSRPASSSARATTTDTDAPPRLNTKDETYALYESGLSIEEISARRGLTEITVEKHLADCIAEGRPFDLTRHVSDADRAAIEITVDRIGTERLKPLRDALPNHITYRMIRFVLADMQRAGRVEETAVE